MPYWKPTETRCDANGVKIEPGHVLQHIESIKNPNYHFETYFICYQDCKDSIQIRDLCNNNVGMAYVEDLVVLGHYSDHPDLLDETDIDWYFTRVEGLKDYEPMTPAERKVTMELLVQSQKDAINNSKSLIGRIQGLFRRILNKLPYFRRRKHYNPVIIDLIRNKDTARKLFSVDRLK